METVKIESNENNPLCTPVEYRMNKRKLYTKSKGWVTHGEFQQHLIDSCKRREVHSDGFLAITTESAYVCECGFEGVFKAEKCARCGRIIT